MNWKWNRFPFPLPMIRTHYVDKLNEHHVGLLMKMDPTSFTYHFSRCIKYVKKRIVEWFFERITNSDEFLVLIIFDRCGDGNAIANICERIRSWLMCRMRITRCKMAWFSFKFIDKKNLFNIFAMINHTSQCVYRCVYT